MTSKGKPPVKLPTSFKALADTNEDVSRRDSFTIRDPRLISEEPGFNLRKYDDPKVEAQIEKFAQAYAAKQYVPALICIMEKDGTIYPVEGHCRRRGALRAQERGFEVEMTILPFKGQPESTKTLKAQCTEVMLRSAEGLELEPLQQAFGYLRLKNDEGYTNGEIAKALSKTEARVEQLLLLAEADPRVHVLIESGKVSADTAIEALRDHKGDTAEYLEQMLEVAQSQGKSKVTRSVMRGVSLPPKVLTNVVGSISKIFESMDKKTKTQLAKWENADPRELKGQKVEIDALALMQLVKANHEVEEVKAKRDKKSQDVEAANAQQDLIDGAHSK